MYLLSLGLSVLAGCAEQDEAAEASGRDARALPVQPQWFEDITDAVGLDFVYETGDAGRFRFPEIMGGGGALFDYDNDGDLDIYLTNGHTALPSPKGKGGLVNKLFRQEADGRFVEVTAQAGVSDHGYGMGVATGDVDNDGDIDIYVTNYGPDSLYLNDGDGGFTRAELSANAVVDGWSCSACLFDYDRDGLLDVYVARYVEVNALKECSDHLGRPDYCSPRAMYPVHDKLLHNEGNGSFADVSVIAGIASVSAAGLGVVCEDFNDDGWIDVYVANDAYANNLWINQHDGTFVDHAILTGSALNLHGHAEAGMGVVAADLDNDADLDLFMTHLRYESNTFYANLGGGLGFADVSGEKGLTLSSTPFTGFGTAAFDVELDGDLDIFVANGAVVRGPVRQDAAVPTPWNEYAEPNLFYLNDGTGSFRSINAAVSSLVSPVEVSRGVAAGDIDSDGDLDLLVSNLESKARLYRNDAPRAGHWLGVQAIDERYRRDAIGAQVVVVAGERRWLRTINSGYSYLSSNDVRAHFGLGSVETIDHVEVRWPDGSAEAFPVKTIDRYVVLKRGEGAPRP